MKNEKEAEDVLQDAYLKIWNNVNSYDKSKGKLFTWLINICRYTAFDRLRSKWYKQSRFQAEDIDIERIVQNKPFNPEIIDVNNTLEELPNDLKQVINMTYFEGYSHNDIAHLLNLPLGTVKSRIRRAIKIMRNRYED